MSEQNTNTELKKDSGTSKMTLGIMTFVGLACVTVLMMILGGKGYDASGCHVITSSTFGNAGQQAWTVLPDHQQMQYLSSFNFEVPESPLGLENAKYRAYSQQVAEVYYLDEDDVVIILMSKAYTCDGAPMYVPTKEYNFVSTKEMAGHAVKIYGDNEGYSSLAEWSVDAYAFAVLTLNHPITFEQLEDIVPYMN